MRLELRLDEGTGSWRQHSSGGDRLIVKNVGIQSRIGLDVWQCNGIPADVADLHTQLMSILTTSSGLVDVAHTLAGTIWGSSLCVVVDGRTGDRLFLPDVAHSVRLFYRHSKKGVLLDTELANLLRGDALEWNINFLVSFATTQFGISGQTPFAGIHIVPPGCALLVSSSGMIAIEKIWPANNREASFPSAVERVYSHLGRSVSDVVLALSGGVDSSSSAIFLRQAIGPYVPLRAIHFYTSLSPDYHEKCFAEKISSAIGAELIPIDIESYLPFKLTRTDKPPIVLSQEMMFIATNRAIQAEIGKEATILEGEGGDLLFHAVPDVDVIEDAFLDGGVRTALQTASKLARLHNGSIPRLVVMAALRRIRQHLPLSNKIVPVGIGDEIIDTHNALSWSLDLPPNRCYSSFDRLVKALDSFLEITDPVGTRSLKRINPLLAPPIVDAALGLKPHESFSEENDRIVLRQLAAQFCNSDVIWRRTKGSFDAGILRGMQAHQEQYLSLIDNGVLMDMGLITRSRIVDALRKVAVGQSSAGITLALIGCIEIYCASWKDYLAEPSATYSIASELNT